MKAQDILAGWSGAFFLRALHRAAAATGLLSFCASRRYDADRLAYLPRVTALS
jgi:hypothetical protein